MSFDEQMKEMRDNAREAMKRTTIDRVIVLHHDLKRVQIPAHLLGKIKRQDLNSNELALWMMAHMADLLNIATWAWYRMKEDEDTLSAKDKEEEK